MIYRYYTLFYGQINKCWPVGALLSWLPCPFDKVPLILESILAYGIARSFSLPLNMSAAYTESVSFL